MKNLLDMLASVEKYGIAGSDRSNPRKIFKYTSGPVKEDFYNRFEICHSFVFSNSGPVFEHLNEKLIEMGPAVDDELDAPFPVFSVELIDGPISIFKSPEGDITETFCVMCVEIRPKEYVFYSMARYPSNENPKGYNNITWASNAEAPIIKHYLNRINKERMGSENVRVKLNIGSGKTKRRHEIRRIIHVTPKKNMMQELYTPGSRSVDWSHRFEVRGHWVKLELDENGCQKVGKNRNGDYIVSGFTWRTHHVRGPEHLPLVKKTRLVKSI